MIFFYFLVVKFSIYLNRRVFVMKLQNIEIPPNVAPYTVDPCTPLFLLGEQGPQRHASVSISKTVGVSLNHHENTSI